jgi:cytochrome c oxidase subunit II
VRRHRLVLALAALAFLAAACAPNATQSALEPKGPNAETINDLFIPIAWIAAGVFFVVEGLILWFLFKYRHREGRTRVPPQIHGNTRLEIGWTILPTLVLVVVAVPTVATLFELARDPGPEALDVRVVGHQWWWEFRYTDPELRTADGEPLVTANQLYVPTGRTVELTLDCDPESQAGVGRAVIHSFWVPELFGKQDCIPGHLNRITMQAETPGTYEGQCYEFCGLSHANMRVLVEALSPGDFDAWAAGQLRDAAEPAAGSLAAEGFDAFTNGACINCHAIQGTEAAAPGGPNLTHFASRDCFAGCVFDNSDPRQVAAWLRNPPALKPGSQMPNYHLSEDEIRALVAYLETLT